MRFVYFALQICIALGTMVMFVEFVDRRSAGPALIIGCVLALIATAILYWSIRGIKRLLGYPPEPPIVPAKSAFDALRPRNSGPFVLRRQKQIDRTD